jgi:DNA modification methylase
MKVIERKLSELEPFEKNAKKHPNVQIKKIVRSIEEFGFTNPILTIEHDGKHLIVAGHARYKAAKEAGLQTVPTIDLGLPYEKAVAYGVADNRLAELADWDEALLAALIEDMKAMDVDIRLTGFDRDEISAILDRQASEDEDEQSHAKVEPRCRRGEVWRLGDHRLMCGDATSEDDMAMLMGPDLAKLCFTSPPYNMAGSMYEDYKDDLRSVAYIDLHLNAVKAMRPFLRGFVFWNVSYNRNSRWEFIEILHRMIKESGLRFLELIVWDKGHGLPVTSRDGLTRQYEDVLLLGDEEEIRKDLELVGISASQDKVYFNKLSQRGITNYWRVDTGSSQTDGNKACFPIELPRKGISLMTRRDDMVIDQFGGSGTTLIACEQLGRKCRMMELEPAMCELIMQRWEEYTGKKAELISNARANS